jgi:hypothetical protein
MNSKLISILIILIGIISIIFRKGFSILQIKKLLLFKKLNPVSNDLSSSALEKIGMSFYAIISVIVGIFFILIGVLGLFGVVKILN